MENIYNLDQTADNFSDLHKTAGNNPPEWKKKAGGVSELDQILEEMDSLSETNREIFDKAKADQDLLDEEDLTFFSEDGIMGEKLNG